MSMEEFAVGAAQSGILTDKEAVQLFLYFTVSFKLVFPYIWFSDTKNVFIAKMLTCSIDIKKKNIYFENLDSD